MEKTYYLVHLYFGKVNEKNCYTIYSYQKSRRFTAKQAWYYLYHEQQKELAASGDLPVYATIDDYWNIIEKHGLDKKACDRYCTMGFIE
jgi:hypothetical protein